MQNVVLPELGEGIESATVVMWHKTVGDAVCKDDDLVEVVTDKATFNVISEFSGVLSKVCAQVDEQASIGSILAVIEGK